jgi:hypothetical protein
MLMVIIPLLLVGRVDLVAIFHSQMEGVGREVNNASSAYSSQSSRKIMKVRRVGSDGEESGLTLRRALSVSRPRSLTLAGQMSPGFPWRSKTQLRAKKSGQIQPDDSLSESSTSSNEGERDDRRAGCPPSSDVAAALQAREADEEEDPFQQITKVNLGTNFLQNTRAKNDEEPHPHPCPVPSTRKENGANKKRKVVHRLPSSNVHNTEQNQADLLVGEADYMPLPQAVSRSSSLTESPPRLPQRLVLALPDSPHEEKSDSAASPSIPIRHRRASSVRIDTSLLCISDTGQGSGISIYHNITYLILIMTIIDVKPTEPEIEAEPEQTAMGRVYATIRDAGETL